jgi:hypothetical protein
VLTLTTSLERRLTSILRAALASTARRPDRPRGLHSGVALAAAIASAVALAGPVAATAPRADDRATSTAAGSYTDANDTIGPLDVHRVSYRVSQVDRGHLLVTYRVRTWERFATTLLDVDERTFVLDLNRDAEAGAEREVRVAARDGRLVAEVISPATREVIGTVDVSRPNGSAIQISGPRRILGARSYFWTSNYHLAGSNQCGDVHGHPLVCQDDVPDHGWLRMDSAAWPQGD